MCKLHDYIEEIICLKKYTKISEINLSAFIYRLFHEDFSSIVGINTVLIVTIEENFS